jgi:hypothetical protein
MDDTRVYPSPVTMFNTTQKSNIISKNETSYSQDFTLIVENQPEIAQSESLEEETSHIVKFHTNQCIAGLIIHASFYILSPLSMIFIRFIYGKYLPHNMGFGCNIFLMHEVIIWIWIYFSVFAYYHLEDRISDFYGLFICAGIIVFLRNVMVAIKYANYTKEDWDEMKTRYLNLQEIVKKLLLASWVNIPTHLLDAEIAAAFKRRRIDENKMCVSFYGPAPTYFKPKKTDHETNPDQSCLIHANNTCASIGTVARYFAGKVNEKIGQTRMTKLMFRISILYVVTPYIVKVVVHGPESYQADPFEIVFYILSFPTALFCCYTFLSFLGVGAIDFKRRKFLLEICSAMIYSEYDDRFNIDRAKLDMREAGTVESWYILRTSFLDFGRRYTQRIFLYASLILPVSLVVIVIILLQMVRVVDTTYNIYFISPIMLTMILACIITYIILCGAHLNNMFYIHKDILLHLLEDLPSTLSNSKQAVADWKLAKKSIKRKMQMLDHDLVLRPVKIMSFTLNSNLFSKLIALVLSGLLGILQLIYSS